MNSSIIIPGGDIILVGYSGNGSKVDFTLAKYHFWTPTSIKDLSFLINQLWIYPNPVQQGVILNYSLRTKEETSVRLSDIQGKVLETYVDNENQSNSTHEMTLSLLEGLSAGNYLLTLSSSSGPVSIRIVKW